jgi:hypothetical protein
MITIDHTDNLITITVLGEFTLGDFKEFEELLLYKFKFTGPVRLLFDLREMAGFTLDMAWEEVQFSREHGGDFDRIGIITNSQWMAWSAWLQQLFVDADLRVFEEVSDAQAWIEENDE